MNNFELWQEYKSMPTPAIKKEIILQYLNLVHYVIRKSNLTTNNVLDERDFFQYGIEGLSEAVDRFDPDYGTKFETYAIQRIRGKIIDEIRKLQSKNRIVTNDTTFDTYISTLSIDYHPDDEGGHTLAELIPNNEDSQSVEFEKNEMKELLVKAIKNLNERDRLIITLYYYEELNYQEISKLLNITVSRISQVHSKILKNLRSTLLHLHG